MKVLNIDRDELATYYNSHTISETAKYYHTSFSKIKQLLQDYNLLRSKEAIKKFRENVFQEKYGSNSPFESKVIQDKIKQNNLDKYGVENQFQRKDLMKQRYIEKLGVENPFQSIEIKNRAKQTKLIKYGNENYNNRELAKQTCLNKYNVDNPFKSDIIKKKITETNIEKYGFSSPSQVPKIRAQMDKHRRETFLRDYGVTSNFGTKNWLKGYSHISKPNQEFAKLLDGNNIQYIQEFGLDRYIYDFKVDNILIKINPSATHNVTWSPFGKPVDVLYHYNKSILATQQCFTCIHIFDWDDIDKIIDLIKNKNKLYARNCELKEISIKETDEFLNKYHLQNTCKGQSIRLGLYYNEELVQLMTFGKPRYNKNYTYELLRLCTKSGYSIVGGAERLFKYFINNYSFDNIISYCDNSKFKGNIYYKLGFNLKTSGKPSKHWFNMQIKQHVTDNLLRQRGFDQIFNTNYGKGTNNEELMKLNGFVEIYDCGQNVFEYIK